MERFCSQTATSKYSFSSNGQTHGLIRSPQRRVPKQLAVIFIEHLPESSVETCREVNEPASAELTNVDPRGYGSRLDA